MSIMGAWSEEHSSSPSDNGRSKSATLNLEGREPSQTRRGYSLWSEDRESTRYLAAETVHSVSYAEKVVERIINEKFRALAPTYGVDVTVVAKWALSSLRLRVKRDKHLATVLGAGILLLGTLIVLLPWASISVPVITAISAWAIVLHENMVRVRCVCGNMLRGNFQPSAAPKPSDQDAIDRLAMISQRRSGNLVVFRKNKAFTGSGTLISSEHVVIDVSRGASNKDQEKRPKPKRFTNEDVHSAIIAAMKKIGLADARVEERLFVNGRHLHDNPVLLPNPKQPPNTSVDQTVLKQAALHPTPDARVYVCVEMPSWQGQLVVTLFTRAVHVGGSLYIEWRFYVLRPVWGNLQWIDDLWDESRFQILKRYGLESAIQAAPALLGSGAHLVRARRQTRAVRKRATGQERAIDLGQVFDYGALGSIREDAGSRTTQHYFLDRDLVMSVLLAQEKLIRAINTFLIAKNVDTGQLESQIKVIVEATNKYYSVHLGDVTDSVVAIGKGAQASSSASAPAPQ
jgi:hypothetical protein